MKAKLNNLIREIFLLIEEHQKSKRDTPKTSKDNQDKPPLG